MAGLLTVGRRPSREYKRCMTLHEAYESLGLLPPVEHERRASRRAPLPEGRSTGTSTRTLVEMYLDHERARCSVGYANSHKIRFLFVCLNPAQGLMLKHELAHIHSALNLDVDLSQVTFFPHDGSDHVVRGYRYCSWGTFCDHTVKELEGLERPLGPYGIVRSIKGNGDGHFAACDRDHCHVCLLTERGAHDLINHSTCPIHFQPIPGVAGTTYPAWTREDIANCFRLAKAYEL